MAAFLKSDIFACTGSLKLFMDRFSKHRLKIFNNFIYLSLKNDPNRQIMKIELRKDFRWALLVPTSMGIRFTPNGQPVQSSDTYTMQAKPNPMLPVYLPIWGFEKLIVVKESPISAFIKITWHPGT
jgi:2-dehydro-3-deoxygluconokinase